MCGIYGEVLRDKEVDPDLVLSNLQFLNHRGPDAQGLWLDATKRIGFAFKRLSILDLSSAGNQPMVSEDDNFVIIFNGEIYNYENLRDELREKGHKFFSNSDTEVLLKSYIQWPTNFLSKLEGMFSFAIFDRTKNTIKLARDLAGQKPLYFNHTSEVFKFASELKPILNSNPKPVISKSSLNNYFKYGFSKKNESLIKGYKKLLPGELLEFDLDKWKIDIDSTYCIWNLVKTNAKQRKSSDIEKLSSKLIELLNSSIENQLKADVDVGVMLSGGLDSSIIASLASNIKPSLKTFSAVFPNNSAADESSYSRTIAKHIHSDHHEFALSKITPLDLEEIIFYYDDPLGSPSFIPTYLLTKKIKSFCKVVMGGDGADELFGGYYPYSRIDRFNLSKKPLLKNFYFEPQKIISKLENSHLKGRGILINALKDIKNIHHSMLPWFSNQERKILIGDEPSFINQSNQNFNTEDYLSNILLGDFSYYLPEEVLKKVDRSSMANSLEVRAPYLDSRIINFAFNEVPSKFKVKGRNRKIILQKIGSILLPKNYDFNRKQGFSFPINEYFHLAEWQKFFLSKLAISDCSIDKDHVLKILKHHLSYNNQGIKLFTILIFILWYEKFIQKSFCG